VLHTWGQNLLHHPHLHCLVPGGGISLDGSRWIACRPAFFLSVRVLSRLFRRLFLHYLENAFVAGQLNFFSSLQPLQERCAFLDLVAWSLCKACLNVEAASIMPLERISHARVRSSG